VGKGAGKTRTSTGKGENEVPKRTKASRRKLLHGASPSSEEKCGGNQRQREGGGPPGSTKKKKRGNRDLLEITLIVGTDIPGYPARGPTTPLLKKQKDLGGTGARREMKTAQSDTYGRDSM